MNNSNFTYHESEGRGFPLPPNQTYVSQVQPATTTHYSYLPQQVIRSEVPANYTNVIDHNVRVVQEQPRVLG